jgi:hypothetical protein
VNYLVVPSVCRGTLAFLTMRPRTGDIVVWKGLFQKVHCVIATINVEQQRTAIVLPVVLVVVLLFQVNRLVIVSVLQNIWDCTNVHAVDLTTNKVFHNLLFSLCYTHTHTHIDLNRFHDDKKKEYVWIVGFFVQMCLIFDISLSCLRSYHSGVCTTLTSPQLWCTICCTRGLWFQKIL